jgi:hypothetical protein
LLAFAALLDGRGPEFLLGTQSLRAPYTDLVACPFEFIGQEPVTERWIITVGVNQGVDCLRGLQLPE